MRILAVLVLLLLTGCSFCVTGSGNVIEKDDYSVTYFDSVDLSGVGNLHITQGDKSALRVVAEDNIIANMRFEIMDQELVISQKTCLRNTKPIDVYIVMNDVKSVSLSGSGKIIGENRIESPDLTLDISGSGDIDMDLDVGKLVTSVSGSGKVDLEGTADSHTYKVSGSSRLTAPSLRTAITAIDISGSGDSSVHAGQELSVRISGSGDVVYTGEAAVDSSISGMGKVSKAD
ncbi:DUF2807 domain-containing protein [Candidatus Woesearchaeota archaeon]|nr:DUF2807 domain-containing protein [Candidatus Woesearchaeota archaeon]